MKIIKPNKKCNNSFNILRAGYPNKPFDEQATGKIFRENSTIIANQIAQESIKNLAKDKVVVMLPWRSALAFIPSYTKLHIHNFYHLSSKRNEQTLEAEVDFEEGRINQESIVIIADPMLATGNTIIDAIKRCLQKKVSEKNIIVVSMLAAPEGIKNVESMYPNVKILLGQLDKKLDAKGYITPGLGDFGDKYFFNFNNQDLERILRETKISNKGREKIVNRIKSHGVNEILSAIIERDEKDDKIDILNKNSLTKRGLEIQKNKKIIKIDTGKVIGIKKVTKIITSNVDKNTQIISVEGKSAVGKSTTTKELSKKLKAPILSMGDIFRYLTLLHLAKIKFSKNIFDDMEYRNVSGEMKLFHTRIDIKETYTKLLRESKVEKTIPKIAEKYQKEVIEFCVREITKIRHNSETKILIEGRCFTLDFLPSDLRIKLSADASIRAERRWMEQA